LNQLSVLSFGLLRLLAVLSPGAVVNRLLTSCAGLNSSSSTDCCHNTTTARVANWLCKIDLVISKDFLEIIGTLESSIFSEEVADWNVDRARDISTIESWGWSGIDDFALLFNELADILIVVEVLTVEDVFEVSSCNIISLNSLTFLGPFGKLAVKDLDIGVTHRPEHEGRSICEPSLATVVDNNGMGFADVHCFHDLNEESLTWHHEWEWLCLIFAEIHVEESCSLDMSLSMFCERVRTLSHLD
jgi:hypothetical protein